MVLCKPYPVPEDPKGQIRKICEREGIVYDTRFFRLTTPEHWQFMSRIKGALSRDKYRIQSKIYGTKTDVVLAHSDAFEDILADWRLVTDTLGPILQADESRWKDLPNLIADLLVSKGQGNTWSYRKPSQCATMVHQRRCYDERLQVVRAHGGGSVRNNLNDFEMVRTLGTGSFGRVLLVRDKRDDQYRALKIIRKEVIIKLKQVEHTANEKNILSCISCPFIIHLIDYFQDNRSIYFLMEYINGGEMFTHIHRNHYFSYDITRFFAAQVVMAFEYLHNLDIVYRDLKPENLLIDSIGYMRITDFGFAKMVTDRTWTLCGTPEYLAPEIILSKGYAHAVDWWALGVLLYEMRCGHAPFYDQSQMEMCKKIVEGRLAFPPHFKPDERNIIAQLLTSDLTKRLGNMKRGSQDVKSHPYFR
eukprot:Ihof_evm1s575 gene=Ihof_evmTU1s575